MKEELKTAIYELLKEKFELVELSGETIVVNDEDTGNAYGIDVKMLN